MGVKSVMQKGITPRTPAQIPFLHEANKARMRYDINATRMRQAGSDRGHAKKVIWKPLPGSQALAISCPASFILYEGTRGPGKTDWQVMHFRQHVGKGYGKFWRGVIFDREYKNLDDLIAKTQRWFPEFQDGARLLLSKSDYKWVWPTGEELLFRQMKKPADYWNFHGQEFPYIGFNELCKYPVPDLMDSIMSCNRSSFRPQDHPVVGEDGELNVLLPPIPLVITATTNPYGPGHNWVKKRLIDPVPPGRMQRMTMEVFNPQTRKKEEVTKTMVRIFGSYKENKYLPPEYVMTLESIKEPNKRKAWLEGDWDIVAGGGFDDVWDSTYIVKPRFKVPSGWRVFRAFDWGSTHPFSVGWWAEANGEEVTLPDGTTFAPVAKSLIRFHEWYGCEEGKMGENKGLKLTPEKIAKGILEIEKKLLEGQWIQETPLPGPADNQIWQVHVKASEVGQPSSIGDRMETLGVTWLTSDKSQGSRVNGLELARGMLEAAQTNEEPGMYCMDHCIAFTSLLPTLPRDEDNPDDIDTTAEDHIWDETRYVALAGTDHTADDVSVGFAR